MTKLININDTIDAEHTDGETRKFLWKGPKIHPQIKKRMTLYECDRNSYAEIIKEYKGVPEEGTDHFNRSLGDRLEADAISVYIDTRRKIKSDVVNNSGRHKIQEFKIRDRCIATIKVPLKNLEKHLLSIAEGHDEKKSIENL
jgi:hypothetical protein